VVLGVEAMRRGLLILGILLACAGVGYVLWRATGSAIAGYIVGVAGAAASIAALVPSGRAASVHQRLRARLKLGKVRNADVTGVDTSSPDASATANVRIRDIEGGKVVGVRSRRKK
jgi:hypothetical protein